jgi:hypothetical protein
LQSPKQPREPTIECWGRTDTATSEFENQAEGITTKLGIARLATWRCDTFVEELGTMIDTCCPDFEEVTTKEVDIGGESVTDVFIRFRSEMVAETAKDELDGKMLSGRKLQVGYV